MISPLPALVLLALLFPFPVFAIPVGDILGPTLAWFATMVGFASASLAVITAWTKRRLNITSAIDLYLLITIVIALLTVLASGILYFSWSRYAEEQARIAASFKKDAEKAQEVIDGIHPSSQPPVILPSLYGSGDLISARVASSTKLVPTEILKEVAAEPHWSDRIFILDVREPEEREIGFIPATSTHIRYADLLYELNKVLPTDRDILVICWTSKRGTEITTLLRNNGFPRAFAIQGGLQGEPIQGIPDGDPGWIDAGLPWQGDDRWSDRFTNFTYISLSEAKWRFDHNATIVDTRDKEEFDTWHIPGAVNIPIKYMPTSAVSSSIALLDPRRTTLLMTCAEYVDCFYARILGVRLSRLGWTFDEPFRDLTAWKKAGYPSSP